MKIISGLLKGRTIEGYNIDGTRPTMDRVKESVFAIIQDNIPNATFLDLFSGTGNIGIEAISNGAKVSYFVDNNKIAIDTIKKNITNFNIEDKSILINKDYKTALKYFIEKGIKFDIIYIDPPYKMDCLNEIVNIILANNLLTISGVIILEYNNLAIKFDTNFNIIKTKKYGNKYVSIIVAK